MNPDSSRLDGNDGDETDLQDDGESDVHRSPTGLLQMMDALESRSYQRFVERLVQRSRAAFR